MSNLIVSCDGTWNTPDDKQGDLPSPTNVVKLHNAIAPLDAAGVRQQKYYHPGVGTDGTALQKLAGGVYGLGISANIQGAYRWLADTYQPGDKIFVFGFSRGAYTARSLAGFVGACGLTDLSGLAPKDAWQRIQDAYNKIYRVEKSLRPAITWPRLFSSGTDPAIPLHLVGVWDTVGSLGVPDDLALLNLLDDPSQWAFHDTRLGARVEFARHAVAIDEYRASFTPTFWTDENDRPLNDGDRVKQLWFPGVHCDVGGGYASCGLADGALKWMIEEAAFLGLVFNADFVQQIAPQEKGLLHDSATGAFKALRTRPRNRPLLTKNSPAYHESAWLREAVPPIAQSPYHHPTVVLKVGEESDAIEIYARNHWNETGLFLEDSATYEFTAEGEWLDSTIPSGPEGTNDGKFYLGEIAQMAGTVIGKIEAVFHQLTGNKSADFIMTRRDETIPWFALVGTIANDGPLQGKSPLADGTPYPHQSFPIGRGPTKLTLKPSEAGYLYGYANDAWHFYENNKGSVTLKVKRLA